MKFDQYSLKRLAQASQYYEENGFVPIEVPWTVSPRADEMTKPEDANPISMAVGSHIQENRLPGSGEQGFIQMILDGKLPVGMYQTTTPCWRDERRYDELHRPYFFKLELIVVGSLVAPLVVQCASHFFMRILDPNCVNVVKGQEDTDDAYDIVYKDIELGSYGHRLVENVPYTYGTGCAEPRLGIALSR